MAQKPQWRSGYKISLRSRVLKVQGILERKAGAAMRFKNMKRSEADVPAWGPSHAHGDLAKAVRCPWIREHIAALPSMTS